MKNTNLKIGVIWVFLVTHQKHVPVNKKIIKGKVNNKGLQFTARL